MGMRNPRTALGLGALALLAATLSACATPGASPGGAGSSGAPGAPGIADSVEPGLPDGEVLAQGTVLDSDGSPELCLGAIMESLPPQCSGIPLIGWSWEGVEGAESSGGTTWGAYAVQGTYDGAAFTVTQDPILLALYDPAQPDDPTNGEPGPADAARLDEVQDAVHADLGDAVLTSWPQNGRLWVQVVWDDGTMQDAADATYGDDVVVIHSSLREVG